MAADFDSWFFWVSYRKLQRRVVMENVEAIFMIDNLFASYLENVTCCSLMNMKDSFDFFFIPVQFFFLEFVLF